MKKLLGLILIGCLLCLCASCEWERDYSITGTVALYGDSFPEVSVAIRTLSGNIYDRTVTNALGHYELTLSSDYNGETFEVYAVKPGYSFEPEIYTITMGRETDVEGLDFHVVKPCALGGHIYFGAEPLEGVIMSLEGEEPQTTKTDQSGAYQFVVEDEGSYTVSLAADTSGYYFETQEQSFVLGEDFEDKDNIDFTALPGQSMSGSVTHDGLPMVRILLHVDGEVAMNVRTRSDGIFTLWNLPQGNYTVTPVNCPTVIPDQTDVALGDSAVEHIDFNIESLVWTGDYYIEDHDGSLDDITGYTHINGLLDIRESDLADLSGLECLCTVDGDVIVRDNYSLKRFDGLDNLRSAGGIVWIYFNGTVSELTNFSTLTHVGGYLYVSENHISSFKGIHNITFLGEGLYLTAGNEMTHLDYIPNLPSINGVLSIRGDALIDLTGLEHITSVEALDILSCDQIENLHGLENMTHIGSLGLSLNKSLNDISQLEGITSLENGLAILYCDALEHVDGLRNVQNWGNGICLWRNEMLAGIDALSQAQGSFEYIQIYQNPSLINLDGLDGITDVSEYIQVEDNDSLDNVDGLYQVSHVGGDLIVIFNQSLCQSDAMTLVSEIGEENIDGDIRVGSNKVCE